MTNTQSRIDRAKGYIRINIDYGSGRLKVSFQYVAPGGTVFDAPIVDLEFDGRNIHQEQVLGIDVGGLLAGRRDIQKWIKSNRAHAAGVVYLWKYCLSSDPRCQSSEESRQVYEAIGATFGDLAAIGDLLIDHLKLIKKQTIEYCQKSMRSHKCEIPEDIQMEASITVPASWYAL